MKKVIFMSLVLLLFVGFVWAEVTIIWDDAETTDLEIKGIQFYYTKTYDRTMEDEQICTLTAQKGHINALRDAAWTIVTYAEHWGLNSDYVQECRDAWNNTQKIEKQDNEGG